MVSNNIDPYLYRDRSSELPSINRQNKEPIDKNAFNKMLQVKLPPGVSSSALSRIPSKNQVEEHVGNDAERQKLYNAAQQFESFFMEKMFSTMKKSIQKTGLIDGGKAEEIFDEMLTSERVQQMAHKGDFGLAEMMYRDMVSL